jgi:hypothetical protein
MSCSNTEISQGVKLEFEFVVLNQLVEISRLGLPPMRMSLRSADTDDRSAILANAELGPPKTESTRWSGLTLRQPTDDKFTASGQPLEVQLPRSACLEHGVIQRCHCQTGNLSNG